MTFIDSYSSGDPMDAEMAEFDASSSPVWLLAIAAFAVVAGFITWTFWGFSGAVAGYACALVAFASILMFRRRDTVLRQTSYVVAMPGVRVLLPVLLGATIAVMVVSVIRIATELSRGVG